jgi:hypothetical protein
VIVKPSVASLAVGRRVPAKTSVSPSMRLFEYVGLRLVDGIDVAPRYI